MEKFTEEVFCEIDKLQKKYLDLLVDICNIESKSDNKAGIDEVGACLNNLAKEIGYTCKKKEFEKAGNVYSFTFNPNGEKKMISLSAHMDTVFEKGVFGYPPTRVDGDYIYGPGVMDCKGGIAVAMLAMEALKNCGFKDRPVKLILQSDEEVSSRLSNRGTIDFILEEAKGSAAFINCEGHSEGYIIVSRKGIVKNKITITGKAVHAGICVVGASAIKEAAYKIIELEKDNDLDSITFNCGIINGGIGINTVADKCEIYVEYRFKTQEQKEIAEKKLQRIVNTSYVDGTEATYEVLSVRSAMEKTPENEKLAEIINKISSEHGFENLTMHSSCGGADSAYPSLDGIPTVDSLGIEGSDCHTTDEKALISSISKMAKIISAVIINLENYI